MELLWIAVGIAIVCCALSLSKIGFQLERIADTLAQKGPTERA